MRSIDRRGVTRTTVCVALVFLVSGVLESATGQARQSQRDVVYATVEGRDLGLDLHWPALWLDVHFEGIHVGEHLGNAFNTPRHLVPTLAFLRSAIAR